MKELQDMKGAGFMDVQFLLEAVHTVISVFDYFYFILKYQCRYVLQWTYGYGYFMEDGTTTKALFEGFQEQLEKFTEHLHGLSEKPLDQLKEIKLRTDVINYMRVTEKVLLYLCFFFISQYRDNIVHAIESNFADS